MITLSCIYICMCVCVQSILLDQLMIFVNILCMFTNNPFSSGYMFLRLKSISLASLLRAFFFGHQSTSFFFFPDSSRSF